MMTLSLYYLNKKDFILIEQEDKLLLTVAPEKELLFSCKFSHIVCISITAVKLFSFALGESAL
jgi:hypothetical protein